jgi:hypothetical protein
MGRPVRALRGGSLRGLAQAEEARVRAARAIGVVGRGLYEESRPPARTGRCRAQRCLGGCLWRHRSSLNALGEASGARRRGPPRHSSRDRHPNARVETRPRLHFRQRALNPGLRPINCRSQSSPLASPVQPARTSPMSPSHGRRERQNSGSKLVQARCSGGRRGAGVDEEEAVTLNRAGRRARRLSWDESGSVGCSAKRTSTRESQLWGALDLRLAAGAVRAGVL